MKYALNIKNLKFGYVAGQTVLDIPSLEIEAGERVFMYGPSGCGKSTLLGLVAGVLHSTYGQIEVLDNDLQKKTQENRDRFRGRHLGYIFQMFNLIPYLSAGENILLPCRLNTERRARVEGSLEQAATTLANRLGIQDLLSKRVTELSVGQQQRVAAARAFLGNPELIIADEPTSALDTDHREAFLKLLLEQASESETTVLFVSHDRSLAGSFSRSIGIPDINEASRSRT